MLCNALQNNFKSCYAKPGKADDLHRLRQTPDENFHQFIKCFIEVRNTIPNISDDSVIQAFKQVVRYQRFTEDLNINPPRTVSELFDMDDRYSDANETLEWNRMVDKGTTPPQVGLENVKEKKSKRSEGSTSSKGKPKKKEKGRSKQPTKEVAAIDQ